MSSLIQQSAPLFAKETVVYPPFFHTSTPYRPSLLGHFLNGVLQEYPCRLKEITPHAATLVSSMSVPSGERVTCFLDQIGLLEGIVEKGLEDGFVLSLSLTPHGRRLLAARLQKISDSKGTSKVYQSPKEKFLTFTSSSVLPSQSTIPFQGRLQDFSLYGTYLITTARPPVGTDIFLKNIRCRVEDHQKGGIFLTFPDIKNPKSFRKHFLGHQSAT